MLNSKDIEALASKIADHIVEDERTGAYLGMSKHWVGRRRGHLEALKWVLEEIDFEDSNARFQRVIEKKERE